MTRIARSATLDHELLFDLLIGSVGEFTEEELRLGWLYHGRSLMDDYRGPPGTRPWGWWRFEAGEELPAGQDAQARRLAELGELTEYERAALQERANEARTRIGTGAELISGGISVDRRRVELWECVASHG